MLNLLKFFVVSNLITTAVVVAFEESTGFFGLNFWSDYAFFVVMILWGIAALFFMYPPEGGFGGDKAERVTGSMSMVRWLMKLTTNVFHQTRYFASSFLFLAYQRF